MKRLSKEPSYKGETSENSDHGLSTCRFRGRGQGQGRGKGGSNDERRNKVSFHYHYCRKPGHKEPYVLAKAKG